MPACSDAVYRAAEFHCLPSSLGSILFVREKPTSRFWACRAPGIPFGYIVLPVLLVLPSILRYTARRNPTGLSITTSGDFYLQTEADPSGYFWMLNQAAQLFAKNISVLQFAYLRCRYRAEVLERADWLLAEDRWRYIQSVCSSPRDGTQLKKPNQSVRKGMSANQSLAWPTGSVD
jgi:hypothetical protein